MEGSVDESLYTYPSPFNAITRANKTGTNWYDEIFDVAPIQEYNLSVSGGNEKSYLFLKCWLYESGRDSHLYRI